MALIISFFSKQVMAIYSCYQATQIRDSTNACTIIKWCTKEHLYMLNEATIGRIQLFNMKGGSCSVKDTLVS